jgi:hypothetical protein
MSEGQQTGGWATFGKISAVVAFIAALFGLWTSVTAPKPALEADVSRIEYVPAPYAMEFRESVQEALAPESLSTLFTRLAEQKKISGEWASQPTTAFEVSRGLRNQLDLNETWNEPRFAEFLSASIKNTGEVPISGAVLRVPGATLAIVIREDGSSSEVEGKPSINIGEIASGEDVRVNVWSNLPTRIGDQPSLFHDAGAGRLRIADDLSASEFLTAKRLWPFVFLVLFIVSSGLYLFFKYNSERSRMLERQLGYAEDRIARLKERSR